ncbi:nicotinate (nicotinamide) nucleotide adenylyltransferase [Akkermansia sp. N21169]|jgi:nicotinate-nucleotide adenylyltransferase|uniref:nicotinate (nicotinamide) nucleotide adenylyltransferase n=1 Tax=Akkermansia sp. N21169 TaxID=3040765 RepID=UPI00244EEA19|nr:nicotinate (nicotinamide) nucleotide adenylyltransferase [Akkermansia sp. N21169]MDH3068139.1 nicotinate (nicotinamide) nucleotide adenylyltransferase [Akkermansia sp. N21169]
MNICLFGGSFDPVHAGHLAIAAKAVEACSLDKVIFLPCSLSPLKTDTPDATGDQRMDMLRLATAYLPWAEVDATDLSLPPPSWSWRLAEHFSLQNPGARLFWLMGTDQWTDLEKWNNWQHFVSLVTPIVHHRGTIPQPRSRVQAAFIDGYHPASSTKIRQDLAGHRLPPEGWLSPDVLEYILREHLYAVC